MWLVCADKLNDSLRKCGMISFSIIVCCLSTRWHKYFNFVVSWSRWLCERVVTISFRSTMQSRLAYAHCYEHILN